MTQIPSLPASPRSTAIGADLVVEEARSRHEEIASTIKEIRSDCFTGLIVTAAWPWIIELSDEARGTKWIALLPLIACIYFGINFTYKAWMIRRVVMYLRECVEPLYPELRPGLRVSGWEGWLRKKWKIRVTLHFDNILTTVYWAGLIVINAGAVRAWWDHLK